MDVRILVHGDGDGANTFQLLLLPEKSLLVCLS